MDGEYSIRLRLQASVPEGWLDAHGMYCLSSTAIIAAILGYILVDWLFVPPFKDFTLFHRSDLVGFALYAMSCGLIIGIGEAMRRERRSAIGNPKCTDIVAAGRPGCSVPLLYYSTCEYRACKLSQCRLAETARDSGVS